MKSLTLYRHAKTERDSDSGRDFDRRLDDRGRDDAPRVGREMRDLGLDYDLILSSPAARAAETAELTGLTPSYDERIYDASAGDLLSIVLEAEDDIARLMLIGHNPGFERLASMLLGDRFEMPTGSLVEIELPAKQWRDAGQGVGRLVRFLRPKELA